jgi:hypothetical protein
MAVLGPKEDMMLDVDRDVKATLSGDPPPVGTVDKAVPVPLPAGGQNGRGDGDGGRRDDEGESGGSHLQKARREGKLDLRNGWQVVAGSILIPLGVVLILIAWYGAAHARVVQQQIPYLVSGSFVGLGCMVVGGFLFFGHWLYRIYDQAELHHEEQLRALQAIAAAATWPAAGRPSTAGMPPTVTPGAGPGGLGSYYATVTGTVYHRADCAVIAHHPDDLRQLGADGLSGMLPCQICSPV